MELLEKAKYFLGPRIAEKLYDLANSARNPRARPPSVPTRSVTGVSSPFLTTLSSDRLGVYNPDAIPFRVYKEMETYPQIAASLMVLIYTMFSFEVELRTKDKDIEAFTWKKTLGENLELWRRFLTKVLQALVFGVFLGEKIYLDPRQEPDGQVVYRKLKDLPPDPDLVRIFVNQEREYAGIGYYVESMGKEIYLPPEATFRYSRNERWGNLWGFPKIHAAYTPWYNARLIEMFASRFFEQRVTLPFKAFAPEGKTKNADGELVPNFRLMDELMIKLRDNDGITLPFRESRAGQKEFDVQQLFESAGASAAEAFVEYLRYLNIQIARVILGPDRAAFQDPGTGALASAEKYGEMGLRLAYGEYTLICAEASTHWVNDPVRLTFGKNAPPVSIIPVEPNKEHQQFLHDTFLTAIKTGQVTVAAQKLAELVKVPVLGASPPEEGEPPYASNSDLNPSGDTDGGGAG